MKKLLILVSLLIVAAACAKPPAQPTLETNRNTNLGDDPTLAAAITEADATAKEKAIWETLKQKDYTAFAAMLADDQLEVSTDGVHDKAASVAGVAQFEPSEVTLSDWKFLPIDKSGFIVAYTAAVKGKYAGKDFPPMNARCSSAWMRRNGKWLAVYHQESEIKKPMAMPPPPAKPSASPAAKAEPVTPPGPDPIANEKAVWDLFKSKNYDGFATMLAPDFLEVEPDAFYDKAASVKGVSMFDASKSVLSDFKTVKLDANSSLVTYLVTDPGYAPKGERHSTIYVNRDGKWWGLFHHGGTAVVAPANMPKPAASPAAK